MSSAVFFHNFNEVNLKLWTIACLTTASLATFSVMTKPADTASFPVSLSTEGTQAETSGLYRKARRDFDLALLQTRARGDKKALITALINCAKIDNEFEEDKLAISFAREAVDLSTKLYGQETEQTAEAMATLADVLGDNEKSLSLYKTALAIFRSQGSDDARVARVLCEMSFCYDASGANSAAMSAINASLRIFEHSDLTNTGDYARALVQYATLADLDASEQLSTLKKALSIQESVLGKIHPELTLTLSSLAASEPKFEDKVALLSRALQIDETVFGANSIQVARALAALADANQNAGKKADARDLRNRAAAICREKNAVLSSMSQDFLESYSKLLHDLKFDTDAARVDLLISQKLVPVGSNKNLKAFYSSTNAQGVARNGAEVARNGADDVAGNGEDGVASKGTDGVAQSGAERTPRNNAQNRAEVDAENDAENDPEYWQRTELVPIDNVQKFYSENFDYIQLWYDKGALRLEAFREGELVFKQQFAECPSGIVNAQADHDGFTISWRDGDGPVWHEDVYKLGSKKITLSSSTICDAYAQQMDQQVEDILDGNVEALNNGAVESVPSSYINNNFIADAIRKGEYKALQLYGQGDAASAAERLGLIFDVSTRAINSQRDQVSKGLSRYEGWVDAWKSQTLPKADYITALNDYGFFLQQSGCLKQSAQVLLLVTKVAPERALAHLNLGDSYWQMGKKEDAKLCYQIYLRELIERKNAPARVFQRVHHSSISHSPFNAILRPLSGV